jgi:hypothetical protein
MSSARGTMTSWCSPDSASSSSASLGGDASFASDVISTVSRSRSAPNRSARCSVRLLSTCSSSMRRSRGHHTPAPLNTSAGVASPSSSRTGRVEIVERPVASITRTPDASAARNASRERGWMLPDSSSRVPSMSTRTAS